MDLNIYLVLVLPLRESNRNSWSGYRYNFIYDIKLMLIRCQVNSPRCAIFAHMNIEPSRICTLQLRKVRFSFLSICRTWIQTIRLWKLNMCFLFSMYYCTLGVPLLIFHNLSYPKCRRMQLSEFLQTQQRWRVVKFLEDNCMVAYLKLHQFHSFSVMLVKSFEVSWVVQLVKGRKYSFHAFIEYHHLSKTSKLTCFML